MKRLDEQRHARSNNQSAALVAARLAQKLRATRLGTLLPARRRATGAN